jgi:hypothetical protein
MKNIILVLGMPRSGTSLVAKSLEVFGGEYGDNLLPAVKGVNDRGYWEDRDILALNEDLLRVAKCGWNDLQSVSLDKIDTETLQKFQQRAVLLIEEKVKNTDLLIIKEPRITILQDFWTGVFQLYPVNVQCVVALRNPISVYHSLSRLIGKMITRDDAEPDYIYWLWVRYMLSCKVHLQSLNSIVVDYDSLLSNPRAELERIAERFKLKINEDKFIEFSENFISHDLRHSTSAAEDVFALPGATMLIDVYSTFLRASQMSPDEVIENDVYEKIQLLSSQYESMDSLLRVMDLLRFKNNHTKMLIQEMNGKLI